MRQTCDLRPMVEGERPSAFEDLADIRVAVDQLRENLLDYNPLLAVMADALHKAVELELESRRFNVIPQGDRR